MKRTREAWLIVGVRVVGTWAAALLVGVLSGCADDEAPPGTDDAAWHGEGVDGDVPDPELETVQLALTGCFQCPLASCVKSGFGYGDTWPLGSCGGKYKKHTGIDLKGKAGDAVHAIADGWLQEIYDGGYTADGKVWWGKGIILGHKDKYGQTGYSQYMHVVPVSGLASMTSIKKGTKIGTIKSLPSPYGSHLHFAFWNGTYSTKARRGALPVTACGGDPAFPAQFVNPWSYVSGCIMLALSFLSIV